MTSATPIAPTLGSLIRDPAFARIWSAIFISAAATFFLLMPISAYMLDNGGSLVTANLVVLTQWLPAIIALPAIKVISSKYASRSVLIVSDNFCAILCISTIFVIDTTFALIAVLLVRGAFDSLSKVARTTALRDYFSGATLDRAASYYNTAMLLGGGVGSLLAVFAYDALSMRAIIVICAVLYVLSASIYRTLAAPSSTSQYSALEIDKGQSHSTSVDVYRACFYFVAAVGIFQGFHNFARTAYPVQHLGLDASTIPMMQVITNGSYILGALFAAHIIIKSKYRRLPISMHIVTVSALLALIYPTNSYVGLPLYFLFGLLFEIGFCVHLRFVITQSPKSAVGRYVANMNAGGMAVMVGVAFGASAIAERFGFFSTALGIGLIALAMPTIIEAALFLARKTARNTA